MMNVNKWIVGVLLLIPLSLGLSSCVGGHPQEQQVFVSQKDLKEGTILTPGAEQQGVPILIDQIPEKHVKDILQKMFPGESVIVLTTKEHIKPNIPAMPEVLDDPSTPDVDESRPAIAGYTVKVVPITAPVDEQGNVSLGEWLSQAFPALISVLPPGIAGWGPFAMYLASLFIAKRPRGHLVNAGKALNPAVGGTVDVGEAISSISKAIGWSHTNSSPQELRAVADKLEAEAALDVEVEKAKEKK